MVSGVSGAPGVGLEPTRRGGRGFCTPVVVGLSCAQLRTGARRLVPEMEPRANAASTMSRSPGFGRTLDTKCANEADDSKPYESALKELAGD